MASREDIGRQLRTERLFISVTRDEQDFAHAEAARRGKGLSEAVREALRNAGLLPKPTPREEGGGR